MPVLVASIAAVGVAISEPVKLPQLADRATTGGTTDDAIRRRAELRLDGSVHADAPFYDREALRGGDEVRGPCVIDDHLGTVVVNDGAVAHVLEHGTLRLYV